MDAATQAVDEGRRRCRADRLRPADLQVSPRRATPAMPTWLLRRDTRDRRARHPLAAPAALRKLGKLRLVVQQACTTASASRSCLSPSSRRCAQLPRRRPEGASRNKMGLAGRPSKARSPPTPCWRSSMEEPRPRRRAAQDPGITARTVRPRNSNEGAKAIYRMGLLAALHPWRRRFGSGRSVPRARSTCFATRRTSATGTPLMNRVDMVITVRSAMT